MAVVSNTTTVSIAAVSAPEWFVSQAVGSWTSVAGGASFSGSAYQKGARVTDVVPSPQPPGSTSAITGAWTGGCVDQDRGEFILAANGGHGDYAGTEVYACNLKQEVPAWVRLSDPCASGNLVAGNSQYNTNEVNLDGSIRAVHGWNRCVWGNGRVWYGGLAGMYADGYWSTGCASFNRASLGTGPFPVSAASAPWAFHGRISYSGTPGSNVDWQLGNAVYDPVTKRLWACAQFSQFGNHVYYVTTDGSLTPVAVNITEGGASHSWGVVPYDLGRYWLTKDKSQNRLMILNLSNPTAGWTAKSVPSLAGLGMTQEHGAVYHAASRAIYSWHNNGQNIIKIAVPTDVVNGTYTASIITGTGSTPSAAPSAGTFSRFNIIQDMGNGQGALVLINSISGPIYVYKLPTS